MNYYLIDFENVQTDGVKELYGVKEGDSLIFFYSDQCKMLSLDVLESAGKMNLKLSGYKVKIGTKNALDFQLASHLGFLAGKGSENDRYYIVSNDKGFDCLCDYWSKENISVQRVSLVKPAEKAFGAETVIAAENMAENTAAAAQDAPAEEGQTEAALEIDEAKNTKKNGRKKQAKKKTVEAVDLATMEEIMQCLSEEDDPDVVLKIFNQYKTKQAICNGMAKVFKDSKRTSIIYKKLSPLMKKKKKK